MNNLQKGVTQGAIKPVNDMFQPEEIDLLYEGIMAWKGLTWKQLQAAIYKDKLPEDNPVRRKLEKRYGDLESLHDKFADMLKGGRLLSIKYCLG